MQNIHLCGQELGGAERLQRRDQELLAWAQPHQVSVHLYCTELVINKNTREGVAGNDTTRTNVPDIRVSYRYIGTIAAPTGAQEVQRVSKEWPKLIQKVSKEHPKGVHRALKEHSDKKHLDI